MGAIVSVPRHEVADAKRELYKPKLRFGRAGESNHPFQPQMTDLYFKDLPEHLEQSFADVCKKLGVKDVIFYTPRTRPSGGRGP